MDPSGYTTTEQRRAAARAFARETAKTARAVVDEMRLRDARDITNEATCRTVKRVDLFGAVTDTYQTEAELNGFTLTQGRML